MSNRDELRTRLESLMEQRRSVDSPFAGTPVEAPRTPAVERVAVELDEERQALASALRYADEARRQVGEARRRVAGKEVELREVSASAASAAKADAKIAARREVESRIAEVIDEARDAGVTWAVLSSWMGSTTKVYAQIYRTRLAQRVGNTESTRPVAR